MKTSEMKWGYKRTKTERANREQYESPRQDATKMRYSKRLHAWVPVK